MKSRFLIIIEKGSKNYSAYSPDLPGCVVTARTVEKTVSEMTLAIEFHLEGIVAGGETPPIPRGLRSYLTETDEISTNDIITSIEAQIPEFALA